MWAVYVRAVIGGLTVACCVFVAVVVALSIRWSGRDERELRVIREAEAILAGKRW